MQRTGRELRNNLAVDRHGLIVLLSVVIILVCLLVRMITLDRIQLSNVQFIVTSDPSPAETASPISC